MSKKQGRTASRHSTSTSPPMNRMCMFRNIHYFSVSIVPARGSLNSAPGMGTLRPLANCAEMASGVEVRCIEEGSWSSFIHATHFYSNRHILWFQLWPCEAPDLWTTSEGMSRGMSVIRFAYPGRFIGTSCRAFYATLSKMSSPDNISW